MVNETVYWKVCHVWHYQILYSRVASRAGSWDKYCNSTVFVPAVWRSYCSLHCEIGIDIRDLLKTKLQLYILMIMSYKTSLHIRDITYSAHICHTLQCSKRHFIFLLCDNSLWGRDVSSQMCERVSNVGGVCSGTLYCSAGCRTLWHCRAWLTSSL